MSIPFSQTVFVAAAVVVVVLFTVLLWVAVLAFKALVRFGHSSEETARQIETLSHRLDQLSDSLPHQTGGKAGDDEKDSTP